MSAAVLRIILMLVQSGFAGIVKFTIGLEPTKHTWKNLLATIIVSIFCGWITYHFTCDSDIGSGMQIALVAVAALSGQDLLNLLQFVFKKIVLKKFDISEEEYDSENKK